MSIIMSTMKKWSDTLKIRNLKCLWYYFGGEDVSSSDGPHATLWW